MDYITAKEAAEKWKVSRRAIAYHLKAGRILGAIKKGKLWLIPANAKQPADNRCKTAMPNESSSVLLRDFRQTMEATSKSFPLLAPCSILENIKDENIRRIYEAELSYLQGDFKRVMDCYEQSAKDKAALLRICPIAIAAAISLGDYHAYTGMESNLKQYEKSNTDREIKAFAEFTLATAAVSVIAPNMAPEWLKVGNLSALPLEARSNALYLRAKYFSCIGQFDSALAIAQTALTLTSCEDGMSLTDLYLRLTCATAYYALEQKGDAEDWLLSAMRSYLPHGFITPFAELIAALGGMVERYLEQEFPALYKLVLTQWESTWKNWIVFHNQFTKDNITLILSLREYQIATLAVRHVPYAKIAEQYGISIGRLKNIMLEIHEKLCLSNREELREFIL